MSMDYFLFPLDWKGIQGKEKKLSFPPLVPPLNFFTLSSSSEGREGELFEFYLPPN